MFARVSCPMAVIGVLLWGVVAPAAHGAAPPKQSTLTIDDASVAEGDAGRTAELFTVRLAPSTSKIVSVDFATADGSAGAGDYVPASGTLVFAKGQTTKQVSVDVTGDSSAEADETFVVRLTNARNAVIGDALAQGTILNDDAPPPPPSSAATAYQIDPAHTGAAADAVAPVPSRAWSRDLGGSTSYPLIVGGRVYVTVANTSSYGTRLFALNASDGATAWTADLPGTYYWSAITYDAGRIFAVNYDGVMTAYDAVTGGLQWTTQMPGQYSFSSPPTARAGYVYTGGAGSGGTLYAVRQDNGAVAWTAPVANGDNSSPAVSSSGVYVSYACGVSYAFAPTSGALQWNRVTGCSGGGGKTPVLGAGKLYVRDSSYPAILDAGTGSLLAPFPSSGPAPALDASKRYVLTGTTLRAENLASGSSAWQFSGDGQLRSAPIVAAGTVFVGSSSGNLYGLSSATGAITWSANVGSAIAAPDEQNVSQPLTGLATAGGLLVVPADRTLSAYR